MKDGLQDLPAETDIASEQHTPRGAIRIGLPFSFGLKRVAPLLLAFARQYPEVTLDMDYSDRRMNLIEEGIDLSIRVTRQLAAGDVVRKLGACRMQMVASPDYLARHGRPLHPQDLAHHAFLGYTLSNSTVAFEVNGQPLQVTVRSRLTANNGAVLTEAAAQGMGITCQPEFIIDDFLQAGRVEEILADYPMPALGIYAMLPGNKQIPHRVRVLVDFLAERLARPDGEIRATPGTPGGAL